MWIEIPNTMPEFNGSVFNDWSHAWLGCHVGVPFVTITGWYIGVPWLCFWAEHFWGGNIPFLFTSTISGGGNSQPAVAMKFALNVWGGCWASIFCHQEAPLNVTQKAKI